MHAIAERQRFKEVWGSLGLCSGTTFHPHRIRLCCLRGLAEVEEYSCISNHRPVHDHARARAKARLSL